jgi:hypothetical protein
MGTHYFYLEMVEGEGRKSMNKLTLENNEYP